MSNQRMKTLEGIAREALGLDTLETRGSDGLDFHDLAVWSIRDALERALEAGQRSGAQPTRVTCPACNRAIEIRALT